MNILDFIKNQENKEELFYIGCKNGASFITIGTVDELLTKPYGLQGVDESRKEKYRNSLKRNISLLKTSERLLEETKEKIKFYEDNDIFVPRNILNDLNRRKSNIKSAKRLIARYEKKLENMDIFCNREVIDTYPRTVYDPGTIVVVEGSDNGSYWFHYEVTDSHNEPTV